MSDFESISWDVTQAPACRHDFMRGRHFFLYCLFVCSILFLQPTSTDAADADRPGGYSQEFHDPAFDIILGKVTDVKRDDRLTAYHLSVLGDMRGKMKPGAAVVIKGGHAGTFSAELNIPQAPVGSVLALPAMAVRAPDEWEYRAMGTLPIGLDSTEAVATAHVADALTALRELGAALDAPGAAGPSRERIDQLLCDRNPHLWAFGAWRLSKDASVLELEKLKSLFYKPGRVRDTLGGGQLT